MLYPLLHINGHLIAGAIPPPPFYQQGPGGNGMDMNSRMMPSSFDSYERNIGGKP
jgi:hypothetical protein